MFCTVYMYMYFRFRNQSFNSLFALSNYSCFVLIILKHVAFILIVGLKYVTHAILLCMYHNIQIQGQIQDLIGGPQIVTGLNCRQCAAGSCEQSKPFSAWGLGPALGPRKLLGIFITKYAFSPFWGTFLYYF